MSDKNHQTPKSSGNQEGGLGGIFKGLGDLLDAISDLAEKVKTSEGEIRHSQEFAVKGLHDQTRGVYGFSIRSGIGGIPRVERFGNLRKTEEGPVVADVREPLVDVFDEATEILIVVELPGVNEAQIQVELHADVLAITTTGERLYTKEILLTTQVEAASLQQTYTNGILELRLKKM